MTEKAAVLPIALLSIGLMLAAHASVLDVLKYTGFLLAGIMLPGLVLWRLLGAYRRNLVEDCAAGFAVGITAQLMVYLASASIGLQRWSWVWAPIVLVVAFLDRDARAHIWRRVEQPLRPMQAWLLSAACAIVLLMVYRSGPGQFLPAYTDPSRSYQDLAFQQAVTASAKYDVPIKTLWLGGEQLHYQTFYHESTAATAWATGIDLTPLIHSLTWLPLALAGCALVWALTQRFLSSDGSAGVTWAGPLAVLIAGLGGAIQPSAKVLLGGVSTTGVAYLSPTQNLGNLIALALCLVVVDQLRGKPPRSRWVLLVGLTLAAAGAKGTILPLVGCGFALVFVVQLTERRKARTALLGGGLCVAVFIGAMIALFGGESLGTQIKPFDTFANLTPYAELRRGTGSDRAAQLLTAGANLLSWGLAASGLLFLGRKLRDPGALFLAGFSIAGFMAAILAAQSGLSQMYFLRTAFPVIAVLACVGLAQLVGRLGDRRSAILVAAGGVLGVIACALARWGAADQRGVRGPWTWTVVALVLVAVLVGVGWKLLRRAGGLTTAIVAAGVSAAMVGAVLVPAQALVSDSTLRRAFISPRAGGATEAEAGAASWLRKNSKPGEMIATNAHCVVGRDNTCDSRHFWLAALSERPVLVEGWAYSNRAYTIAIATHKNSNLLPFWDQELLDVNDAAFTTPSAAIIERLRKSGIHWLYADHRAGPISADLGNYVRLRHATLDATIYEIR